MAYRVCKFVMKYIETYTNTYKTLKHTKNEYNLDRPLHLIVTCFFRNVGNHLESESESEHCQVGRTNCNWSCLRQIICIDTVSILKILR